MWHRRATNRFRNKLEIQTFDFSLDTTPMTECEDVHIIDTYGKGKHYKVLKTAGKSCVRMKLNLGHIDIPNNYRLSDFDSIDVVINHCRTVSNGVIDLVLNGSDLLTAYSGAATAIFEEQRFSFPADRFKTGSNELSILLNQESPGEYWLSDVKIVACINYDKLK